MEKENNKCNCPGCHQEFNENQMEKVIEAMSNKITREEFPRIWEENKQRLKLLSRKELAEEMYFAGTFDMFGRTKIEAKFFNETV